MSRNRPWVFGLAALFVVFYIGFSLNRSAGVVQMERQAEQVSQDLTAVADPLARLCDQDPTVRVRVGGACETAVAVVSAPAEDGADGRNGRDGALGAPGRDGQDGQSGAAGQAGATGAPGADGRDGRDGATGEPGADGATGPAGPPGENGKPPAGWVATYSDGSTETCTRAGGADDSPTYTCERSA